MTKDALFGYLGKGAAQGLYLFEKWLGGVDEDSPKEASDMLYFSRLLHGDGAGRTPNGEVEPISSRERCEEASDWIREIFAAIDGKGPYASKTIQDLGRSPFFLLLFIEVLSSFTYWRLFETEAAALIQRLLALDVLSMNQYFRMQLSTAISVNRVNILRNDPEGADIDAFLSLAKHEDPMIANSGYELLYVAAKLNPAALEPREDEILAVLGAEVAAGDDAEPTLRSKAQGSLSNVDSLRAGTPSGSGGALFDNPTAMVGLSSALAPDVSARYARGVREAMGWRKAP